MRLGVAIRCTPKQYHKPVNAEWFLFLVEHVDG